MRAPGEESIPDNRVSLILPYLPVDVVDPVERLKTVRRRIRELKYTHEPEAGAASPPWRSWDRSLPCPEGSGSDCGFLNARSPR